MRNSAESLLIAIFVFLAGLIAGLAWQDIMLRKALLLPFTTLVETARDCRCTCTRQP